ncbi:MAG: nucleotidyltransferase, partial [Bacteroidales bacterium]|nr:nucleotidyltransferase [Bacteroidales bacterium]
YSIYDAVRAGFGKVVYIVREYFKEQFQDTVKKKYSSVRCIDGSPLEFQFVTQELDKIPAGYVVNPERVKPWGTAHALLMAAEAVGEPFAVINGDDYYGRDSFQILADWLRQRENSTGEYCIVGFKLENTLSESGGVSRGICSYDKDNNLIDVVEHHMIAREADGEIRGDNSVTLEHVLLNGSDLCSMNMWGFTPDYFEKSAVIFDSFLAAHSNELKSEFYIPYAVDQMIKKGGDKCTVLCTPSRWFGVTYQQDRPGVVAKFEQLVKDGIYPSPLYENKN